MATSSGSPKSVGLQVLEFTRCLLVIRDSLDLLQKGRTHHLIPISGQLRALCIDSTQKRQYLDRIAEMFGHSPEVWFVPPSRPTSPDGAAVLLDVSGFPITYHRVDVAQQRISVDNFLQTPLFHYKGREHATCDIIKTIANKSGGAHYDTSVPLDINDLMNTTVAGINPIHQLLTQFANALLCNGVDIVRQATENEFLLLVVFEQMPSKTAPLWEGRDPDSPMAYSIRVTPSGQLEFWLRGIDGRESYVRSAVILDSGVFYLISVVVRIQDSMKIEIWLNVNGSNVQMATIEMPIVISFARQNYDIRLNGAVSDQGGDYGFGFSYADQVGVGSDPKSRVDLYSRLLNLVGRPEIRVKMLRPGTYMYGKKGESVIMPHGAVEDRTIVACVQQEGA